MWVIALVLPGGGFIIFDGPGHSWEVADKLVYHYEKTYGHSFQAMKKDTLYHGPAPVLPGPGGKPGTGPASSGRGVA